MWEQTLWQRVVPGTPVHLSPGVLAVLAVAAFVLVTVRPLWNAVRLVVTLTHELGHALVGMLVGRRFAGFVVRGDMSGHAVTVGKPSGSGLALSTWAGYPAPAIVAAGLTAAATSGWSAPVLTGVLVVLLLAALRVRSFLTALVLLASMLGTAALWWWRDAALQASVLIGLAAALLVGAWRQFGAVARSHHPGSDPQSLAAQTGVPRMVWLASFSLTIAAATLGTGWLLARSLGLEIPPLA